MRLHALSLALLLCLPHTAATAAQPRLVLSLGEAMAPLSGPWRFRVGDDLRWAAPGFDDSSWETVDLAAPASATDGDVGLPHYAPGWSARGHGGYYGYAWYRIAVSVRSPMGESLALLGPWAVDSVRVPGIWFPWGVGLSLSECASVTFVLLLFFLLLRRLWFYARRQPV